MCEHYVARAAEPFRLDELWPFTERLEFGGQANLAVLSADGAAHHYAGNGENPVFTFRLGRIGLASTGIYSLDRSLFRFAAPGATDRQLIRTGTAVTLDGDGRASAQA